MNLRVDLILPTEQRSASVVSAKSLVRIAMIVVPLILAVIIASVVMSMMRYRSDLIELERQWKEAEPKKEAAANLRKELAATQDLEKKLMGWKGSRVDWHRQLRGIQKEIPAEARIQLNRLTVNSVLSLEGGKIPVRSDSATLMGTAFGENARVNVENLKQALLKSSTLTGYVNQVEVIRFDQSRDEKASKLDRTFRIDMMYKPRKFE